MTDFINGLMRFRRGPWEMVASILIMIGVIMLMQPFFCLLYTSPSPRDRTRSRMPSSA